MMGITIPFQMMYAAIRTDGGGNLTLTAVSAHPGREAFEGMAISDIAVIDRADVLALVMAKPLPIRLDKTTGLYFTGKRILTADILISEVNPFAVTQFLETLPRNMSETERATALFNFCLPAGIAYHLRELAGEERARITKLVDTRVEQSKTMIGNIPKPDGPDPLAVTVDAIRDRQRL